MIEKERERLAVYDEAGEQYMADLIVEQEEEAQEREHMMLEEDYGHKLDEARAEEIFVQDKEAVLLEAEEYYRHAAKACKKYRAAASGDMELEAKFAEVREELDRGAHQRIQAMLKEQYDEAGKANLYPEEEGRDPQDKECHLVASKLRPLPPDMDSLVMMKRYIHKGKANVPPRKDLSEGFEIE